jgi:hypothetical protein
MAGGFAWRCAGIVFARRCTDVVFTRRHTTVVFAQRCVASSSCCPGVVVTRPSSSHAVARLLSSHRRCCRGIVICIVVVIVTAWSPRGKCTYLPMPPQTAGAVQGQGIRGATTMPLRRHKPCSHTNGGRAQGGFPGQKGGVSVQ